MQTDEETDSMSLESFTSFAIPISFCNEDLVASEALRMPILIPYLKPKCF